MARDPEAIERDIERARNALAATLDEFTTKADPKKFMDSGKANARDKLSDPRVRYALMGVGALVVLVILRKLFR